MLEYCRHREEAEEAEEVHHQSPAEAAVEGVEERACLWQERASKSTDSFQVLLRN